MTALMTISCSGVDGWMSHTDLFGGPHQYGYSVEIWTDLGDSARGGSNPLGEPGVCSYLDVDLTYVMLMCDASI